MNIVLQYKEQDLRNLVESYLFIKKLELRNKDKN